MCQLNRRVVLSRSLLLRREEIICVCSRRTDAPNSGDEEKDCIEMQTQSPRSLIAGHYPTSDTVSYLNPLRNYHSDGVLKDRVIWFVFK